MNDNHKRNAACARVRGRLDELIDGALAPLEAARDLGHLEACGACSLEHDLRAAQLGHWTALGTPSADTWAAATAGLDAALAGATAPRAPRRDHNQTIGGGWRATARAAGLAAAALLLLFGLSELGIFDLPAELDRGQAAGRALGHSNWTINLEALLGDEQ